MYLRDLLLHSGHIFGSNPIITRNLHHTVAYIDVHITSNFRYTSGYDGKIVLVVRKVRRDVGSVKDGCKELRWGVGERWW